MFLRRDRCYVRPRCRNGPHRKMLLQMNNSITNFLFSRGQSAFSVRHQWNEYLFSMDFSRGCTMSVDQPLRILVNNWHDIPGTHNMTTAKQSITQLCAYLIRTTVFSLYVTKSFAHGQAQSPQGARWKLNSVTRFMFAVTGLLHYRL